MEREATKVITLYPSLNGRGHGSEEWEVGKKRLNPDMKPDVVTHILLQENNTVQITWRDFGKEMICSHIEKIEFRNAEYRETQIAKERDREPQDSTRLKKMLNQDSKPKR